MLLEIFQRHVEVIRKSEGHFIQDPSSPDFGSWQEGESQTFLIKANVQPAPAEEVELLPEGYRNKSSYLLITATELFCAEENKTNADIVILYNKKHIILKKKKYETTYLSHYELIAVKMDIDR